MINIILSMYEIQMIQWTNQEQKHIILDIENKNINKK